MLEHRCATLNVYSRTLLMNGNFPFSSLPLRNAKRMPCYGFQMFPHYKIAVVARSFFRFAALRLIDSTNFYRFQRNFSSGIRKGEY